MNYPSIYCPPWEQLREKLIATIGQDPCIYIGELIRIDCEQYEITICVKGRAKADALRMLIPTYYEYGNLEVRAIVRTSYELATSCPMLRSPREIANTICLALSGNILFELCAIVAKDRFNIRENIIVVIRCRCRGDEWLPNLFAEVLKTEYGLILPTTIEFTGDNCIHYEDIYCFNQYC